MEVMPGEPIPDEDLAFRSTDLMEDNVEEPIQAQPARTCFEKGAPAAAPPISSPRMVYKLQYKNDITKEVVYTQEDGEPIVYQSRLKSSGVPIIEHITEVYTTAKSVEEGHDVTHPSLDVLRAGRPYLKINSLAIINALQSVVEYYPQSNLSGSSVYLSEPFAILTYYEKELAVFRDEHAPTQGQSDIERCERENNTYEHLSVLQNFMQRRQKASVENERLRYKRGFATFDMLWLLLRPGTTVYCDTLGDGKLDAYVVQGLTGGITDGRTFTWTIDLWYLDYNGEFIGKRGFTAFQQSFGGEREVMSLEVFPCEFWKAKKSGEGIQDLKKHLEERGRMFYKLASRRCMSYNGFTSTFPQHHVGI